MSSITPPETIPDQVLESHICRLCNKYLTVGPISIHPDGGNICGRCDIGDNKHSQCLFLCENLIQEVNIPYAIFGYVNHLFPCINRYEGCKKLLTFNEIKSHEINCKSKEFECLQCGNYIGSSSQQLSHFMSKHALNIFERTYFRFPLDERFCMSLIKRGNDMFFVCLNIDLDKQNVDFCVRPATQQLDDDVDFFCLLKDSADGELIYQTTLTKRTKDKIYHSIHVKDKDDLLKMSLFCECLLKRITMNKN